MPEQKCLKWPTNLLEDKRHRNKSIYVSDFCTRNKRIPQRTRAKTKETTRYAKDIFNPSTRFLNDHFQTSSHLDLKNHCEKILNSIEKTSSADREYRYQGKGKRSPLYSGLPSTPDLLDDGVPVGSVLPASLRRIESAWNEEANATKRERGYIYGKAGTKTWYHQRKNSASKNSKSLLPGMNKWLNEANEFEKQVVHNFMNNVSDALQDERPQSASFSDQQPQQHYSDNPKLEDYLDDYANDSEEIARPQTPQVEVSRPQTPQYEEEYYLLDEPYSQSSLQQNDEKFKNVSFKQPDLEELISPRSQNLIESKEYVIDPVIINQQPDFDEIRLSPTGVRSYPKYDRPSSCQSLRRPATATSSYPRIPRAQSAQGRYTSDKTPRDLRCQSARSYHETEAEPYRPQLLSTNVNKKGTGNKHRHKHTHRGSNCETCHNREMKEMAAQLAGMKPISDNKTRYKGKMAITDMYKMSLKDYGLTEDYMDNGSVFKKVGERAPGHFIIHPEWVSERAAPRKSYR